MTDFNPFLGARPYSPADQALFFGRDSATDMLVERVCLRPLTVIAAPSGIGKTSLLRAAVLPELERQGMCTAYIRADPDDSGDAAAPLLAEAFIDCLASLLLPDPEAEFRCLNTVLARDPTLSTLGQAQAWFQKLPCHDPARVALLGSFDGPSDQITLLARCLRGTVAPEAFGMQLERLGSGAADPHGQDMRLGEIAQLLAEPGFLRTVSMARQQLRRGGSDDDLFAAIRDLTQEGEALLVRPDGDPDFRVRIVVVLDQFEQLFTMATPEARSRAFSRLGALLSADLALHLVLSLRKEWYADLIQNMPSLSSAGETADRTTFHLLPLTHVESEEVMTKVPRTAGVAKFTDDQKKMLWEGLQQDDSVDAVALSIACYELFATGITERAETRESLGIERLLQGYLTRAIEAIADKNDRDEALDVLGEIAGTEATRSFVTYAQLRAAKLRDPARRDRVLDRLQRAFLIKGDMPNRKFDRVYDIMHERLLGSLRQHIASQGHIAAFREAAERLAGADAAGLDWQRCCTLLLGAGRLRLDGRSAAILLRSIVRELTVERMAELKARRGYLEKLAPEKKSPEEMLRRMLEDFARIASTAPIGVGMAERRRLSWWLTPDEIEHRLSGAPDESADAHAIASAVRGSTGVARESVKGLVRRIPTPITPSPEYRP